VLLHNSDNQIKVKNKMIKKKSKNKKTRKNKPINPWGNTLNDLR
jgi:hypothetical protein